MAAYLIVDSDWKETPTDVRAQFGRAAQPVINRYGGIFLTPPGRAVESLEGTWSPSIVTIIAFPDVAAARDLWASEEFRAAVAIRQATEAVFNVVLIDGSPA